MTTVTTAYEERLLTDYVFFTQEVWRLRGRAVKHPIGPLEIDMLKWIANGPMYGGPAARGLLSFRFSGKTNLGTISYCLWRWYRNPDTKIIVLSDTAPFARSVLRDIRQCFFILPFMRHMMPGDVQRKKDLDTMDRFDVGGIRPTMHPSLFAAGVKNQLQGRRADLIVADDVEGEINTQTPAGRQRLRERVRELTNVATFGDAEILVFGTYHHEDSLYLKLAVSGYEFRSYPLLAPHPEHQILNLAPFVKNEINAGRLKPCTGPTSWDGDCVAGSRFTADYITRRIREGHRNFGMQHMLLTDTGQSMKHPLRLDDLIVWNVDRDRAPLTITYGKRIPQTNPSLPWESTRLEHLTVQHGFGNDGFYNPITFDTQMREYTGTKAGLDPSQGGDPMGLSIVGHLNGFLYVKHAGKFPGTSSPDNLLMIVTALRMHRADELHIESNNGGDAIARLIEPLLIRYAVPTGGKDENGLEYEHGWHCNVHLIHNTGQKEIRILDVLAPPAQMHRLVIDESVAANPEFQRQWTMITRQKGCLDEDDLIDSLSIAVKPWGYEMTIDAERAAERQRQEIADEALAEMQGRGKHARNRRSKRYWAHSVSGRHF